MGLQESFDKMLGLVTGSNDPLLLKSVIEVQRELVGLQEENRNLRNEIHDLKNDVVLSSELKFEDNVYYRNGNKERAYCTRCYDADKLLINMNRWVPAFKTCYNYKCPNCNRNFETSIVHNVNTDAKF